MVSHDVVSHYQYNSMAFKAPRGGGFRSMLVLLFKKSLGGSCCAVLFLNKQGNGKSNVNLGGKKQNGFVLSKCGATVYLNTVPR